MPVATVVSGSVESITGSPTTSGYVEFQLRPSSKGILFFVPGEGVISPEPVRVSINGSGLFSTNLWGNDVISPGNTYYDVVVAPDGQQVTRVRRLLISGPTYNLSSPVFAPAVELVPQYQTITTTPISNNLTPAANNSFTVGQPNRKWSAGYFANIFADSISGLVAAAIDFVQGGLGAITRTVQSKLRDDVSLLDFGGDSTGATSSDTAMSNAIVYCKANGRKLHIPAGIWKFNSAWNCTNVDDLIIFGDGMEPPAFNLALVAPTKGTVLNFNTGAGGWMIDALGANGFVLRDVSVNSIGQSTPATRGILLGTSNRADAGGPGSTGNLLQNVSVYLPTAVGSIGVHGFNLNLSKLQQVWVVADRCLVMVDTNVFGITPPYGTLGAAIESDGNTLDTVSFLNYGVGHCIYLKNANDLQGVQVYLNTIAGGVGYAGEAFAIYMEDCIDVDLKVEVDYLPSVIRLAGPCSNINIDGISFPSTTPIPANIPLIAFLDGISYDNCHFNVKMIMGAAPNNNYFYTSVGGGSPTVTRIKNCTFIYDTTVSAFIAFLNVTAALALPLFDLAFHGDSDTGTFTFQVVGATATQDKYRAYVNGEPIARVIPALANSATPSVKFGQGLRRKFLTGGTTTITNFTDGFTGLEIVIIAEHTLIITDGTNIFVHGSANLTLNATDVLSLVQKADGKWYEVDFSDNT